MVAGLYITGKDAVESLEVSLESHVTDYDNFRCTVKVLRGVPKLQGVEYSGEGRNLAIATAVAISKVVGAVTEALISEELYKRLFTDYPA